MLNTLLSTIAHDHVVITTLVVLFALQALDVVSGIGSAIRNKDYNTATVSNFLGRDGQKLVTIVVAFASATLALPYNTAVGVLIAGSAALVASSIASIVENVAEIFGTQDKLFEGLIAQLLNFIVEKFTGLGNKPILPPAPIPLPAPNETTPPTAA